MECWNSGIVGLNQCKSESFTSFHRFRYFHCSFYSIAQNLQAWIQDRQLSALFRIDDRRFLLLPGDGLHRAGLLAETAHLAFFRDDPELNQIRADQGRASFLLNVGFVFVPEVTDRGEHGIGSALSKTAVGRILDMFAQSFQEVDILHRSLPGSDSVQDIEHDLQADAAGDAFSAGFIDREVGEEPGRIHHAGRVVHDDEAARAHHGPCLIERIEIDLRIKKRSREGRLRKVRRSGWP